MTETPYAPERYQRVALCPECAGQAKAGCGECGGKGAIPF